MDLQDTLKERQKQHGEFRHYAKAAYGIKTAVGLHEKIPMGLSIVQEEALHMICSKLARLTTGDLNHRDHWHDIAGYATLVDEELARLEGLTELHDNEDSSPASVGL